MADLIVKKYGNRRLYDTESSRYITLDELATLIRAGRDVRVVDAKSGADLTKGVLLQIISDQERDLDLLPTSFLARVIRANDATMREALHRYLTLSFDAFLGAQRELEARYRDLASSFWNPLSWMPGAAGSGSAGATSAAPATPAAPAPGDAPPPEPSAAEPSEPEPQPQAEAPADAAARPPTSAASAASAPSDASGAAPSAATSDAATKAQIAALRSQVDQIQQLLSSMQDTEES